MDVFSNGANGYRDPPIMFQDSTNGFSNCDENRIVLGAQRKRCGLLGQLVRELHNMSRCQFQGKLRDAARAGKVSQDSFVKELLRMEFPGVQLSRKARAECGELPWECPVETAPAWFQSDNFDEFFEGLAKHFPETIAAYRKEWEDLRANGPTK